MTTPKANIIKQATLNFQFHQPENKFAIPGKVENWFLHKALDEIGQVCDELASEGDYIEIDTIEINLGQLTGRQFENGSAHLLKEKLRGEMKAILAEKGEYFSTSLDERSNEKGGITTIFINFLNKGYLPWQSSFASISELEAEMRTRLNGAEAAFWRQIIPLLSIEPIQKRLAFNFSPAFIQWLIKKVLDHLSLLIPPDMKVDQLDSLEKREKALAKLGKFLLAPPSNAISKEKHKAALDRWKEGRESSSRKGSDENQEDKIKEGIFIANAGVILMHPFLPALFANLELTHDNSFKNERDRGKAICLLHYLVFGHVALDESQVVLPKLICGMPFGDPLQYCPDLSKEDKEEVDSAIEHAIRHWEILKNTGVDSFRETFLKREGQLHVYDQFIEIDVEQKAVDMLIGHLPWTLSRIKLPWMDKRFHVNWA